MGICTFTFKLQTHRLIHLLLKNYHHKCKDSILKFEPKIRTFSLILIVLVASKSQILKFEPKIRTFSLILIVLVASCKLQRPVNVFHFLYSMHTGQYHSTLSVNSLYLFTLIDIFQSLSYDMTYIGC